MDLVGIYPTEIYLLSVLIAKAASRRLSPGEKTSPITSLDSFTLSNLRAAQSSDTENHGDLEIPSDPNAMGPSMRSPYSATASPAYGLCDEHDAEQIKLLRSSRLGSLYH